MLPSLQQTTESATWSHAPAWDARLGLCVTDREITRKPTGVVVICQRMTLQSHWLSQQQLFKSNLNEKAGKNRIRKSNQLCHKTAFRRLFGTRIWINFLSFLFSVIQNHIKLLRGPVTLYLTEEHLMCTCPALISTKWLLLSNFQLFPSLLLATNKYIYSVWLVSVN